MAAKPKKSFESIEQNGLKALELMDRHRAVLEPRLPAGIEEGLQTDLESFGTLVPKVGVVRGTKVAATVRQNAVLASGHTLVSATRDAIKAAGAPREVRAAFGVGRRLNNKLVKSVSGALQQIVEAAESDEEAARSFGVLPSDLDRIREVRDRLSGADSTQESLKARAPLTTRERNIVANRIINATNRIAGAGILHFAGDKLAAAEFQKLLTAGSPKPKRRAGAAKKAA